MANNDKILVDGIIDERLIKCIPSDRRDEIFEFLANEQILKDFALSSDDILGGIVDGRNDGGIDAIYVIVNGHLVNDVEAFVWPRSGCELNIVFVTCKHHDTFKLAPVDSLVASISELIDFSLPNDSLSADYNSDVLDARSRLLNTYRKTSPRLQEFSFEIFYASRGDTKDIGENIESRSSQLIEIVKRNFSNVEAKFIFFGSTEIIESYRKSQIYSYDLKFQQVMSKNETYLLLVKLKDYCDFVSDEDKLKRYFFDSNVRAYMGLNTVNRDIRQTLRDERAPDFWWLNNGVTILTTNAVVIGNSITIENVQIVNGLQTTESIFQFFNGGGEDEEGRSLLIKVIVSNEDEIRDQIIRATNNQTAVESVALHATDKIQRDVEEILLKNGLYYERRTNYYANQGINPQKIITPLYLAAGVTSLCLKLPWVAAHFKSRYLREEKRYNDIFQKQPLNVFPIIAEILKRTDRFIESTRPQRGTFDAYQRRYRHIISSMVLAKLCNTLNFGSRDILNVNLDEVNYEIFNEIWELIHKNKARISTVRTSRKKNEVIKRLNLLVKHHRISGLERYRRMPHNIEPKRPRGFRRVYITEEFIEDVRNLLPPQPWPVGIHKKIIKTLNSTNNKVSTAIHELIERGEILKQIDGVLYNKDGSVHSFDEKRVDSKTLKLKDEAD